MKKTATTFAGLAVLWMFMAGCAEDPCKDKVYLFVVSDFQFVGASLYVDGHKLGVLEEQHYSGPDSRLKNFKFSSGARLSYKEGKEPPSSNYHDICVPPGKHTLKAVFGAYKPLLQFETQKENYFRIDFQAWKIKGP